MTHANDAPATTDTPRVHSVQTGRIRDHGDPNATDPLRRPWRSAYVKEPVVGPVRAERLGLAGDEQEDQEAHGGPDQALLAYALAHYAPWRAELGEPAMGPGGFGENLTVTGLDEHTVRVGDVWRIGTVRLRVTQHRGPCSTISRRWGRPDMVKRVTDTLRMGWYLAVDEPGGLAAGEPIVVERRGDPRWTIARVFELWTQPARDLEAAVALARASDLPVRTRDELARRAAAATAGHAP